MRFITRRVRLAVCTTETLRRSPSPASTWVLPSAVHGVGQVDRDARRVGDREALRARPSSGSLNSTLTMILPPWIEEKFIDSTAFFACAQASGAASAKASAPRAAPSFAEVRITEGRVHFLSPLLASSRSGRHALPLGPVAGAVLNDFLELDLAFGHVRDQPEVLAHVVALLDAVERLVGANQGVRVLPPAKACPPSSAARAGRPRAAPCGDSGPAPRRRPRPSLGGVSLRGLNGSGRSKPSYVNGSNGFTAGSGSILRGRPFSESRTNCFRSSSSELQPATHERRGGYEYPALHFLRSPWPPPPPCPWRSCAAWRPLPRRGSGRSWRPLPSTSSAVLRRIELEVGEQHDARHLRHVAREGAQVVVVAA